MSRLKQAFKTLAEPKFWIEAGVVIAGRTGSDLVNGLAASLPLPAPVKPFIGPLVVIGVGSVVGDKYGRALKIGAMVNAVETGLEMLGIGAGA